LQVELPGITLVGTAHVSAESVKEVREVIQRVKPQVVAVELDENRKLALTDKKRFEETPITDLLRSGKSSFILAQTMLASYQRRMGAKLGVEPGAEMLAAIRESEATGSSLALVDRDIGITLRRAYALMGFREKVRLSWEMLKSLVGATDEKDDVDVDSILQEDVLSTMMGELAEMAPSVAKVLVHERDAYLASNIHEAAKQGTVVAVLGAGHLKGVEQYLRNPETIPDKKAFEVVPKKFPWGTVVTVALTLLVLGIFAWSFYVGIRTGNYSGFLGHLEAYILCTGGMCALGALLARGHPLSVLTGAVAAPTKIFHPFVGSGIFPGLVEARMRKPTVKDFQSITHLETFGDLFRNGVTRVLMVTSLAQLGADIGFYAIFLPYTLGHGLF
jgi:pheromone shutdown-related protein TraB